jgi:hypothetical protein
MTNQEFIEKWYPNYSSSCFIAYNEDLNKLMNNEHEEGDDADILLIDLYSGDIKHPRIETDFYESQCMIYEEALQNFIKTIGL